jgi:hypothetical protein
VILDLAPREASESVELDIDDLNTGSFLLFAKDPASSSSYESISSLSNYFSRLII